MNATAIDSIEAYLMTCPGRRDTFEFEIEEHAAAWVSILEKPMLREKPRVVIERTGTRVMVWLPKALS